MRVVIDTNVVLLALYEPDSAPGRLLRAAALERLHLCAPETVRNELGRILQRRLGYTPRDVDSLVRGLPIEWIEEPIYRGALGTARDALRDPDDIPILACAIAIGCDLVSGDKDLHAARIEGIRVWRPAELDRQ